MSAGRVGLAALAVLVVFVIWREVESRINKAPSSTSRPSIVALALESLLLTLFAALWFGSLGAGGFVVLFLTVGALIEVPQRLRTTPVADLPWLAILAGMGRVVLAGWVLGMVMG